MKWISQLRRRWARFLHNDELKQKIYSIVFESDTPQGKMFDIILIGSIILSVLLVILESMHIFPRSAYLALRIMEYVLTLFFTIEYLARVYCLKQPLKYVFSFFGIVDLLATLPVYLSFFHSCLPPDSYFQGVQVVSFHQGRELAFAFPLDERAQNPYLFLFCADSCNVHGHGHVHD